MAQPRTSSSPSTRATSPATAQSPDTWQIEKGWTVYDAVGHPLGNVTEVDHHAGRLWVDGRPSGHGSFELQLNAVRHARENEVHLGLTVDPTSSPAGGRPRFVDGTPATTSPAAAAASAVPTATATRASPGRSDDAATTHRGGPAPIWTEFDESRSGNGLTKALVAAALGGLAAGGYYAWRRRRRKSAWERFVDASTDFARHRHPAWWAGLAAAALPIAYYAWPAERAQPSYTDQARDRLGLTSDWRGLLPVQRATWLDTLSERLPSYDDFLSDSDTSPAWDLALPGALLALSGLALYLASKRGDGDRVPMKVSDVMTQRPQVVRPDATVVEAAAMMRSLDVGALPVCDGSRLVGMLTDRDIAIRSAADGRDPQLTLVRDIMSPGITWATADDPVEAAARIMREHRIRRLPIVDDRHNLVGIVSLGDIAVDVSDDQVSGTTLEQISEPARPRR